MLLPVLILAVFAVRSQTGNLREEITGKWRNSANGIVEFRVEGDTLFGWQNGKFDDRFTYRFVDDSHIEITDLYASKKQAKPAKRLCKAIIRGDTLEMSFDSYGTQVVNRLVRVRP